MPGMTFVEQEYYNANRIRASQNYGLTLSDQVKVKQFAKGVQSLSVDTRAENLEYVYALFDRLSQIRIFLISIFSINMLSLICLSVIWVSIEIGQRCAKVHFRDRPPRVIWFQRLLKYVPKFIQLIAIFFMLDYFQEEMNQFLSDIDKDRRYFASALADRMLKEVADFKQDGQLSAWNSLYFMAFVVIFIWVCDLVRMVLWIYQKSRMIKFIGLKIIKKSKIKP